MGAIESREVKHEAWEKTTFEQTNEEAACEESAVRFDLRLAGADESPEQHHNRQLQPRTNLLQHQVRKKLSSHVGDVSDGDRCKMGKLE